MLKGIDVSHHNGTPDFGQAKAAGVSFVYVKATDGIGFTDPMFQPNMFNAMRAGLLVGAYHFARPSNDPLKEADHFIKTISVFKYSLLPALDLEVDEGKSGDELHQWARSFVNRVKEKTGHNCLFYTYVEFIDQFPELKQLNDLPVWIAVYRSTVPDFGWDKWTVWQYTENGNVPGVGTCDCDYVRDLNEIMIQRRETKKILLKRGSTGYWVKQLQERLGIPVDGIFGRQTEQAVRDFQKAHGLVVDGIVGPKTWAALLRT